jgi:hypothetical protein
MLNFFNHIILPETFQDCQFIEIDNCTITHFHYAGVCKPSNDYWKAKYYFNSYDGRHQFYFYQHLN